MRPAKSATFSLTIDTWSIRYLVAGTGTWIKSRPVVIPAIALGRIDRDDGPVPVEMTIEEVRDSPGTKSAQTVSGRYRLALQQCQFLPHYWTPETVPDGAAIFPLALGKVRVDEAKSANLRSVREVIGYRVLGLDGEIGDIGDFVLDDATWVVRHILIRPQFRRFFRIAQLSPNCVEGLSWERQRLTAAVTRGNMKWHRTKFWHRAYGPQEDEVMDLRDGSHRAGRPRC